MTRASRHLAVTTALLTAVLLVLGALAALSLRSASAVLDRLPGRATVQVVTAPGPDGLAGVVFDASAPAAEGTPARVALPDATPSGAVVLVAYDPQDPTRLVSADDDVIRRVDRAFGDLSTLVLVAVTAAGLLAVRGLRHRAVARRPGRPAEVRRVRQQSGLVSRSWLELEGGRRAPVAFDPALLTLPSPATVTVHGDPARDRHVAVRVDGRLLHTTGRLRAGEPRGRVLDMPSRPGPDAAERAALAAPLRRQLRHDLVLTVPAVPLGLLWSALDGGGATSWVAATAVGAAAALWGAALLGSDPS